jgi:hypothetical protein
VPVRVPLDVTGEFVTVKIAGRESPTEVTEPEDVLQGAPLSVAPAPPHCIQLPEVPSADAATGREPEPYIFRPIAPAVRVMGDVAENAACARAFVKYRFPDSDTRAVV